MRQENNEDRMKVYLIGAGPGDPGLLTIKGKDILEKADVVVYDYLANDTLLGLIFFISLYPPITFFTR